MGIDQLGFQSVQLGYLKILQMGNIDPNNTKAGKRIRGPSAITARCLSDKNNQSVTTLMIALYLSGMTHLSAGHNVALSQFYLNRSHQGTATSACSNFLPRWSRPTQQGLPWSSNPEAQTYRRKLYSTVVRTHKLTDSSRSLSNVDSSHLTGINRKSYSRLSSTPPSRSKQRRVTPNTAGTSLELKSRSSNVQEKTLLNCRENTQAHRFFALPLQRRLKPPNWYQSKELLKMSSTPPVSLQTTTEIDGNLPEKCSNEQYLSRVSLGKTMRKMSGSKYAKC
ncbi:hypothetical protein F511_26118 [Dorcoceras hygrometricum]|uniref:Uncharacterized protein n=1 Tax=Dorcoceras hygrometricum TaxID=472368 RepID=A0A2Z7DDH2_9LAMI|nr:hypothetical protein F511_26118 [Dorcoceras hygrometricum]